MMQKFGIALLVLTSLPLAAGAMTPDQIASAPHAYNRQHIDVTGRVEHVRVERLPNGTQYESFSICATRCVQAVVVGAPAVTQGQTITVRGTYYGWKTFGTYTVRHAIQVDAGSL
ncbi:MAG TPA: hypothetical protein VMG98_05865 [Verrucomicrobiae bacterium]|nr:hypothetical protein [Verrucomicrobiae bacterium]